VVDIRIKIHFVQLKKIKESGITIMGVRKKCVNACGNMLREWRERLIVSEQVEIDFDECFHSIR
jgi:hypothetical protein